MRITDRGALDEALRQIQRAKERVEDTSAKAASGVAISRPSDDPVGFTDISAREELLGRLEGYNRNISITRSRLGATESALQSSVGILNRLRELTMIALNDVANTGAVPREAEELYRQLLATANQSYAGEYLFAGYAAGAPFSGARFVGDNQKRAVEISPLGATVFGVSAQEAFGVLPGQDAYQGIADTVAGMRTGDRAAVRAGLDAIDRQLGYLAASMASLGAQQNTLSVAERANEEYALELRKSLGRRRDIDPAAVYSRLAADRYAMEATFAVLGSASRMSLIKYL